MTTGVFATRVVTHGVDVTVNVFYAHTGRGRVSRIETVINDPAGLEVLRRLFDLDELQAPATPQNTHRPARIYVLTDDGNRSRSSTPSSTTGRFARARRTRGARCYEPSTDTSRKYIHDARIPA